MVDTRFSIALHKKDWIILELIQKYFGVGNIFKNGENGVQFRVESIRDLSNVIIPHFEKFPLISSAAEKNSLILSYSSKLFKLWFERSI